MKNRPSSAHIALFTGGSSTALTSATAGALVRCPSADTALGTRGPSAKTALGTLGAAHWAVGTAAKERKAMLTPHTKEVSVIYLFIYEQGLTEPILALNSRSFCLYLPSIDMTRQQLHAPMRRHYNKDQGSVCLESPDVNFRVCIPVEIGYCIDSAEILQWEQHGSRG